MPTYFLGNAHTTNFRPSEEKIHCYQPCGLKSEIGLSFPYIETPKETVLKKNKIFCRCLIYIINISPQRLVFLLGRKNLERLGSANFIIELLLVIKGIAWYSQKVSKKYLYILFSSSIKAILGLLFFA